MQPIIQVQDVHKQYKVGKNLVKALNGVSFAINKGEFVAITGESGSGKSTLLQLIGCLDKPTSGSIHINGQDTNRLSDNKRSELRQKEIGFVFQSFYLQPFLTLKDNVTVPNMFRGDKKAQVHNMATLLLGRVGLADRANHFPSELSGGQIQRAAIARALANQPKILLADEPTGNLDSENSDSIVGLFREICTDYGVTVVVVTHNKEIAAQADRTLTVKDGVLL